MEEFMAFDSDKSGFITRDELCQIIIMHGGSGDYCKKAWNIFDLNKDGKVTCQGMFKTLKKRKTELISILTESFVGALALAEKNMKRDSIKCEIVRSYVLQGKAAQCDMNIAKQSINI